MGSKIKEATNTSPLETLPNKLFGEQFERGCVCFQLEQDPAKVRKQGEGYSQMSAQSSQTKDCFGKTILMKVNKQMSRNDSGINIFSVITRKARLCQTLQSKLKEYRNNKIKKPNCLAAQLPSCFSSPLTTHHSLITILAFIAIFTISLLNCSVAFAQNYQSYKDEVRVAINDSGFHTFKYKTISITGQNTYFIYNKSNWQKIATIAPTNVLTITLNNGKFDLTIKGQPYLSQIDGNLIITCQGGLLGVNGLRRAGKQALYRGKFELDRISNNNAFYLINVVRLQDYLKGVVPNEMPVRFGLEALKAQSIAAKNYVLAPRTWQRAFDVDDSVASQVYYGANSETSLSNQAVAQTNGLVALYDWKLITTVFSSTAGGYTESYENAFSDPCSKSFPGKAKPYLKGRPDLLYVQPLNSEEAARKYYTTRPDSYDIKSPYYRWTKEWGDNTENGAGIAELHDVLSKTLVSMSKTGFVSPKFSYGDDLGNLIAIKVDKRGVSGKAMVVEIITDKNTYHVEKELTIRRTFQKNGISLPSANVVFDNIYDANHNLVKVIAHGGGFGHGVGMSQYGAGFMATYLHKPFDKILKRYYTGITIATCPVIISSYPAQQVVSQTFFAPYKRGVLVIDDKYQLSHVKLVINGQTKNISLGKSLIPTHRLERIDISSYIKPHENNSVTFFYPMEEGNNKGIRLYIELVGKDDSEYNF